MNPPYTKVKFGLIKAIAEYDAGNLISRRFYWYNPADSVAFGMILRIFTRRP